MLQSDAIQTMRTDIPGLQAFRVTGRVEKNDMDAMGAHMNDIFDTTEKVDMLLVFETDKSSAPGSGFSLDAMKAQAQSLAKVRNYVVANAPGQADSVIEGMGKIMPVTAKAFDTEAAALHWLRDQPALER